jgi:hypothetical protein
MRYRITSNITKTRLYSTKSIPVADVPVGEFRDFQVVEILANLTQTDSADPMDDFDDQFGFEEACLMEAVVLGNEIQLDVYLNAHYILTTLQNDLKLWGFEQTDCKPEGYSYNSLILMDTSTLANKLVEITQKWVDQDPDVDLRFDPEEP